MEAVEEEFEESLWCSGPCSVLLPIVIVLVLSPLLLLWILFGWLQMRRLKSYLRSFEEKHAPLELHAIRPSSMKYGFWREKADRLLAEQKTLMKHRSLQLGISLHFVLEELRPLYDEKTKHAAGWKPHKWKFTRSGFLVAVLDDGETGVHDVPACDPPADPNFHQLASLLAYGPHALGKGQICPRDGLPDCSIVDALHHQNQSSKATWYLSWVWGYTLDTVSRALSSWWHRVRIKMGQDALEAEEHDEYVWWCFFVNNQFRMLAAGSVEEHGDLVDMFGRQLEGIGRMIICLDRFDKSQYTCRIWCILELFVAVKRHIPITLAFDHRDLDFIDTQVTSLHDVYTLCRVDSEQARASLTEDEYTIKSRIRQEHGSFQFVNRTVEQLLVTEVLQYLELENKAGEVAVQPVQEEDSRYFGVSLDFVLAELKCLYKKWSPQAEWRVHDHCEVTYSGFKVKVRDCSDVERGVPAWDDLLVCNPPENPNFYQLAGLLAYGPYALGKGQRCPRDGLPDCSLVDALHKEGKSGTANWFLSWVWAYTLNDVCAALARWWDTQVATVASASGSMSIYLWWCFFVNNQFRMLEDGITQDTDSLLKVFAEPLERTGKVLMCMDKFQNCTYTNRIWCIFEVFSALRRNIPVTLIMPELEMDQEIETLTQLADACRVDVKNATASVKADEDKIKMHIRNELKSFTHVSQKVEEALWIEMMKKFNARKAKESLQNSSSGEQHGCMVS
eukprot:Skav209094  [mRNA]  locus=scaffold207:1003485:1005680:- [translate_table: standard]